MKDAKALAYVNAYGVLATLENLCELDDDAKAVCQALKKPVSLCFEVVNGPCVTYNFSKEGCKLTEGDYGCTAKMKFASPEKFNDLIDNAKPGVPVKGVVTVLSFLLGPFTKLTDILVKYLRPSDEDMKNPDFFRKSTILTMYTIGGAVCALANNDKICKISAGNTCDGDIQMGVKDEVYVTVRVKDNKFTLVKEKPETPRAIMEFKTLEVASKLFRGEASGMGEVCAGNIRMAGMINMIDNVNKILDRVAVYLA